MEHRIIAESASPGHSRDSFKVLHALLLVLAVGILSACDTSGASSAPTSTPLPPGLAQATATLASTFTAAPPFTATPTLAPPTTATLQPSATASAVPSETPLPPTTTPSPTWTPEPSATTPPPTLTATPTLDPFAPYYIETLLARSYGEGAIEIGPLLEETATFQRYAFTYPSDGLRVTGYVNLPRGAGPFPVILLNHGYYFLNEYRQGDGTRPAADYLASRGYLTLASDYRNYAGSDPGPNPFRFGYVVDVMNLLASLDTLPQGWADTSRVGMWGHSMGGGITVNAAVLAGDALDAAVIYAGMSGDMADNARHIQAMWQRDEFNGPIREWGGPDEHPQAYERMSAIRYLNRARAALSIHHGTHDEQVPYPWSEKLRDAALAADLLVEHWSYPGGPHSFRGETWTLFMERVVAFFDREVQGQ